MQYSRLVPVGNNARAFSVHWLGADHVVYNERFESEQHQKNTRAFTSEGSGKLCKSLEGVLAVLVLSDRVQAEPFPTVFFYLYGRIYEDESPNITA